MLCLFSVGRKKKIHVLILKNVSVVGGGAQDLYLTFFYFHIGLKGLY